MGTGQSRSVAFCGTGDSWAGWPGSVTRMGDYLVIAGCSAISTGSPGGRTGGAETVGTGRTRGVPVDDPVPFGPPRPHLVQARSGVRTRGMGQESPSEQAADAGGPADGGAPGRHSGPEIPRGPRRSSTAACAVAHAAASRPGRTIAAVMTCGAAPASRARTPRSRSAQEASCSSKPPRWTNRRRSMTWKEPATASTSRAPEPAQRAPWCPGSKMGVRGATRSRPAAVAISLHRLGRVR